MTGNPDGKPQSFFLGARTDRKASVFFFDQNNKQAWHNIHRHAILTDYNEYIPESCLNHLHRG